MDVHATDVGCVADDDDVNLFIRLQGSGRELQRGKSTLIGTSLLHWYGLQEQTPLTDALRCCVWFLQTGQHKWVQDRKLRNVQVKS